MLEKKEIKKVVVIAIGSIVTIVIVMKNLFACVA